MKRDKIDRQIMELIQQTPACMTPPEDPARSGRLWDSIQRDGLRAVRSRRIRRTFLCVAASMLALFMGSLLISFLWDTSGVNAFKEGLTRDIRTHGDEVSIQYRDDGCASAETFEPIIIEDGTIADVQSLNIFIPVPKALPEDMAFDTAHILYPARGLADVTLVYADRGSAPLIVRYHYGKRNLSMQVDCDSVREYVWDGIEVTHFIHDDDSMDTCMWHIGGYLIQVNAGIDLTQLRALFDDINTQAYEAWKKGDWYVQ